MNRKEKADIYDIVTERVCNSLENGIIPWRRPWFGAFEGAYNRITKKPYSILNQILLSKGGEWASYKQWTELGGKPQKGKGEIVTFWKVDYVYKKDENGEYVLDDKGEKETKPRFTLRYYYVWNVEDVDGVEPLKAEERPMNKPIGSAEEVVNSYIARTGLNFENTKPSNRAYYSPLNDFVQVPMITQYDKVEEYYSTLFHELTHSTGHQSRLAREEVMNVNFFGSQDYSKEELVAEMGSCFLMNSLGMEIPKTETNSVAYIQSWLSKLKNDKKFLIQASTKAKYATEFILGIENEYTPKAEPKEEQKSEPKAEPKAEPKKSAKKSSKKSSKKKTAKKPSSKPSNDDARKYFQIEYAKMREIYELLGRCYEKQSLYHDLKGLRETQRMIDRIAKERAKMITDCDKHGFERIWDFIDEEWQKDHYKYYGDYSYDSAVRLAKEYKYKNCK